VWVRLLGSLKGAVIVSTSLNNSMHLLAVFTNLIVTVTFITVLHRFLRVISKLKNLVAWS